MREPRRDLRLQLIAGIDWNALLGAALGLPTFDCELLTIIVSASGE